MPKNKQSNFIATVKTPNIGFIKKYIANSEIGRGGGYSAEVESSRTSLASRTSSRTQFEVLGLGLEGQVLGLEASSPRKLACPRLEDSTIFWNVKFCGALEKLFGKRFLVEIA